MLRKIKRALNRFLKSYILPPIFFLVVKLIYSTLKVELRSEEGVDFSSGRKLIGLWHGHFFVIAGYLTQHAKNSCVITSYSDDGETLSRVIRMLGGSTVRGDERKYAARALVGAIRRFRSGENIVFALDGPIGPAYKAKGGAVLTAKKLNAPLYLCKVKAESAFRFRSWDGLFIPKPFSKVELLISKALYFEGDEEDETRQQRIEAVMAEL